MRRPCSRTRTCAGPDAVKCRLKGGNDQARFGIKTAALGSKWLRKRRFGPECARPRSQQRPNAERNVSFQHLANVAACCARGRAHSGLVGGLGLGFPFSAMKPKRLPSPPYNPGVRDLIEAGMLRGQPADPDGFPYVIGKSGKAEFSPNSPLYKLEPFYRRF